MSLGESGEGEGVDADGRAFVLLRDILACRRRVPLDGRSSKVLQMLLTGSAADALVTADVFAVHLGPQKQRRPNVYFRRLAPAVASELLDRGSVASVTSPVVIGLPAGEVAMTHGFPAWSYDAKLVCIVPTDSVLRIIVRASPERWQVPFVRPVPPDGPLALPPELPDWVPTQVEHRVFANGLACPCCGVESSRYREVREALVCELCCRSFDYSP
ncbi:MAG TPA: hypothetical protein VM925_10010 [Labilithrix sp.]|nr:hypothetical protein [Labilithrix sp.]